MLTESLETRYADAETKYLMKLYELRVRTFVQHWTATRLGCWPIVLLFLFFNFGHARHLKWLPGIYSVITTLWIGGLFLVPCVFIPCMRRYRAIMAYHAEKMNEINQIIRELWRTTYRGDGKPTGELSGIWGKLYFHPWIERMPDLISLWQFLVFWSYLRFKILFSWP